LVGEGHRLSVTPSNSFFLTSIGEELENSELISQVIFAGGDLCFDNAGIRLKAKLGAGFDFADEMAFICEHFVELWPSIGRILEVSTLFLILSNDIREIRNEDWLFEN
jgi:hypothetical protein